MGQLLGVRAIRVDSQCPAQIVSRLQPGEPKADYRGGVAVGVATGHAAEVRQAGLVAFWDDGGEYQLLTFFTQQLPHPPRHPLI